MRHKDLRTLLGAIGLSLLSALLGACGGGGTTPPPGNITVTVEDPQGVGFHGAYQVGSGTWQALTFSGGTANFSLSGNTKYGVAIRCHGSGGQPDRVHLIQATNTELATPKVVCSTPPVNKVNFTLTVKVSGLSTAQVGDVVIVSSGAGGTFFSYLAPVTNTSTPVAVPLDGVPAGSQDLLVGVVGAPSPTSNPSALTYRAAKVLRGVNITAGGSYSASITDADVLSSGSLTVNLPSGFTPDSTLYFVEYFSKDNRGWGRVGGGNTSPVSYRQVSGFSAGAGDRYVALATAEQGPEASPVRSLHAYKGFTSGDPTLALPNPWDSNALTADGNAHPQVSGLRSYTASDLRSYQIRLENANLIYEALISKDWLGSATSYTFPDLTGPLGYTAYGNGNTVRISVTATLSPQNILALDPNDLSSLTASDDIRGSVATGSFTVGGGSVTFP